MNAANIDMNNQLTHLIMINLQLEVYEKRLNLEQNVITNLYANFSFPWTMKEYRTVPGTVLPYIRVYSIQFSSSVVRTYVSTFVRT